MAEFSLRGSTVPSSLRAARPTNCAADEVSNFCATACGVGDRFQTIADHAKRKRGNTADTSVSAVIGALAAGFLGT